MGSMKDGKLTPRQRAAIRHALRRFDIPIHARHFKLTGRIESIFTFDLYPVDDDTVESMLANQADGMVGIWHARARSLDHKSAQDWDQTTKRQVHRITANLVARVGSGDVERTIGSGGLALHVVKQASPAEVRVALKESK